MAKNCTPQLNSNNVATEDTLSSQSATLVPTQALIVLHSLLGSHHELRAWFK